MGFDELTPCQLASSVGKNSVGLMVSSVPSEGVDSLIAPTNGNSLTASTNHNSTTQVTTGNSPTHSTSGGLPTSSTKSTSILAMDFEPHSPEFQETFAGLESGLDLTVRSFKFS